MAWAVLSIWVLVILLVGAGVMWAAGKEASSAFLSSQEGEKKKEAKKIVGFPFKTFKA